MGESRHVDGSVAKTDQTEEGCPFCGKPMLLHPPTGERACSDPRCRGAHGYEQTDWKRLCRNLVDPTPGTWQKALREAREALNK
jgi:predicted nucleic acid-binding Zn ribbon protein